MEQRPTCPSQYRSAQGRATYHGGRQIPAAGLQRNPTGTRPYDVDSVHVRLRRATGRELPQIARQDCARVIARSDRLNLNASDLTEFLHESVVPWPVRFVF